MRPSLTRYALVFMKLCHLNVLWTLDPGVVRKISHQHTAFQQAALPNDQFDSVIVVRESLLSALHPPPGLQILSVPEDGPRFIRDASLPFKAWNHLSCRLSGYDGIVTRWPIPTGTFLDTVRRFPVFTEHHSKEVEESYGAKGFKPLVRRHLESRNSRRVLASARGLVGVTHEIRDYELARAGMNKASLVLPNGISVEDIPVRHPPTYDGTALECVFVSSGFAPWHGLDRVLAGLSAWRDTRKIAFKLHLVGRLSAKQLTIIRDLGLTGCVIRHGLLYGSELDAVFSRCHIAIGSLALHRNGLKEACPLKAREYAARNLPFVAAYEDPDFPAGTPWLHRIPADDSPLDIDTLVTFADRAYADSTTFGNMRRFAGNRLSWTNKMATLVDFVRREIESDGPAGND